MNNLVSVIIPVYNSETYIEECVKSILSQTYDNYEIIFIDDGSVDLSKNIILKYAANCNKIKYFYQENKGVSSARNLGIEKSCGEYITFVDSDDYVECNYLETLINNITKYNGQISIIGNYRLKRKTFFFNNTIKLFNYQEALLESITTNNIDCNVWGKLYKRDILNNIFFNTDIKIGEDKLFFYQVLKKASIIINDTNKLYFYRKTPYSAITKELDERIIGCKQVHDFLCEQWISEFPYYKNYFLKDKFISYSRIVQNHLFDKEKKSKKYLQIFYKEIKQQNMHEVYSVCNKKEKIIIFLIKHNLLLLKIYQRFKMKGESK